MAEIINLRRVRKRLARDAGAEAAAASRAKHGQTQAERDAAAAAQARTRRTLDGAKLTQLSHPPGDREPPE